MWEFVEKKVGTGASGTITFSGLDGDTDKIYYLTGLIAPDASAEARLYPNGSGSNLDGEYAEAPSSSWVVTSTPGGFLGGIDDESKLIDLMFYADKTGGIQRRILFRLAVGHLAPYPIFGGMSWENSTTNLTSIEINLTASANFLTTTELWLYKLAQPLG